MFNDPEIYRSLARQRADELIEEANRERLVKKARDGRRHDTKRRGGS